LGSKNLPHTIYGTVGTGLARLGVLKEIRSRVLNHADDIKSDVTIANYDVHDYINEKLDALTKWERHVRKVVNADLKDLGVGTMGDRKRLLSATASMRVAIPPPTVRRLLPLLGIRWPRCP
jgi:hypothetical protein